MSKDRLYAWALSTVLLVGIGTAGIECSSPSCGNGVKEGDEQCDNGAENGASDNNCSAQCQLTSIARASIQISVNRVAIDVPTYPSYPTPTCKDLGIDKMHIQLSGPTVKDEVVPCSTSQVMYQPVDPGVYQATVTMLGADGNAISKSVSSLMTEVKVATTVTNINVAFQQGDYLKQDYTGNLDFLLGWGASGKGCDAASPAVEKESLTLTLPGETTPVAATTKDNRPVDGTEAACWKSSSTSTYEEIAGLPWGHYDLTVTGSSGGVTLYCQKFDVFVGVGVGVPTYDLVVPAAVTDADGGAACP